MKIVILDGYTTDEGQLSWGEFEKLGELVYYERTPFDKVVERAKPADILIVNKVILSKEVLSQLDNLKYIGLLSTGYNVVDLDYAKKRSIPVCNIPNYSSNGSRQTLAICQPRRLGKMQRLLLYYSIYYRA